MAIQAFPKKQILRISWTNIHWTLVKFEIALYCISCLFLLWHKWHHIIWMHTRRLRQIANLMLNECRSKKPKNELKDSSRMKYNMVGCWMLLVTSFRTKIKRDETGSLDVELHGRSNIANLLFYLLTSEM